MTKWLLILALCAVLYFIFYTGTPDYQSPHFYDGRFHNAVETQNNRQDIFRSAYKILFKSKDLTPVSQPPVIHVTDSYAKRDTMGRLETVWAGHASVFIKYNGLKILTDPVFSERASFTDFFGPKRFQPFNPLQNTDTGTLDAVIISHNHYDHLDKKAVKALKNRTKMFIVSLGVGQYLVRWGVDPMRIIELDWGDTYLNGDLSITAAPASHMSKRGIFDKDKTFWSSFVISVGSYNLYFSADTGYIPDFSVLGKNYGYFDIAFLDIGAYNPAWKQNHMTPEEAVRAAKDLNAHLVIPIHWGTFQLSDFHWKEPIERFTAEASRRKIVFSTPIQGEPVIYNEYLPKSNWWQSVD